jgi:hypothetical protein
MSKISQKLGLTALATSFTLSLAFAQPNAPAPLPATAPSSLSSPLWLASDVYKADVYDGAENKIGNVSNLVIARSGTVETAVIGVGGFLGVGQKDVAVPFKDLKVRSREGKDWLVLERSKDDLIKAPRFDKAASPAKG